MADPPDDSPDDSPDGPTGERAGGAGAVVVAEPGQRLLARVVDTLVVGLPVVLVVRAALPEGAAEDLTAPALAGALLLYESVQLALWGRTLGKRLAGIAVVPAAARDVPRGRGGAAPGTESGGTARRSRSRREGLGVARSMLRTAAYVLPIAVRPVPVLGLVAGLLWVANVAALFERPYRQAGHDRLAGTLVLERPPAPPAPPPRRPDRH